MIFAYIKCLTIKSSLLYLAIYKIFACHTNDGFSLCRFVFIIILYHFMLKEYVFFCKIGLSPFEIRFQSSLPIVFLEITNDVWQKFIISLYIICKKKLFFFENPIRIITSLHLKFSINYLQKYAIPFCFKEKFASHAHCP